MAPVLPTVTALVPVCDAAGYLETALESALAQDYPAELLDVVVVDDGSRDDSAAVAAAVAARHPGRVRVLRQRNAGTAAAVNQARAAAGGQLLALLDADDAWPADKLRRQVAVLAEHPDVGLVYGDMTVVDAGGAVVRESWLSLVWDGEPPAGPRCFGALLAANAATASSILLRAELARRLGPIPAHLRCADWWLALGAARAGAIAYVPEPRTHYRLHGANLGLGAEGAVLGRAHARRAAVQRAHLRTVAPGELEPVELALAWNAFEGNVADALQHLGSPFATVLAVEDADRLAGRAGREGAAALLAAGADAAAFAAATRAAAADPFEPATLALQAAAWERLEA